MWSITSSFATGTSYHSLWVHAKRHYDDAAITAYWRPQMHKELMNACGDNGVSDLLDGHKQVRVSTRKFLARRDLHFETVWRAIEPAWCPG
jgi:hypothetical protein